MTQLPTPFIFSQAALQDFEDCRRRFQLRYLERTAWPALETEPAEEHERQLQLGERFHRLVHQNHLGMPLDLLEKTIHEPLLQTWFQGYLSNYPDGLPQQRYPEVALAAPIGEHRLLAKFDLLAIEPGKRLVIVDWKTGARPISRRTLAGRMQTQVYRYILVEAGKSLNGGIEVDPAAVEMVYWFAAAPDQPVRFDYSALQHEETSREIERIMETLQGLGPQEFPLTDDQDRCRFCRYRSLCDRGVAAGELADLGIGPDPGDFDFDLDLEQIAEIDF